MVISISLTYCVFLSFVSMKNWKFHIESKPKIVLWICNAEHCRPSRRRLVPSSTLNALARFFFALDNHCFFASCQVKFSHILYPYSTLDQPGKCVCLVKKSQNKLMILRRFHILQEFSLKIIMNVLCSARFINDFMLELFVFQLFSSILFLLSSLNTRIF